MTPEDKAFRRHREAIYVAAAITKSVAAEPNPGDYPMWNAAVWIRAGVDALAEFRIVNGWDGDGK